MKKDCSCLCFVLGLFGLCFAFIFLVPSIIIFFFTTNRTLYAGIEWKNDSITKQSEFLSFNPRNCSKDKYFYPQPLLLYLEVKAPSDTGLTLYLLNHYNDSNSSMKTIGCIAQSDETCTIQVHNLDEFAFVSLDNNPSPSSIVSWTCFYFNLPFLLSLIMIGLCGCIFLTFIIKVSLCCLCCVCGDCDTGDHRGARLVDSYNFTGPSYRTGAGHVLRRPNFSDRTPLIQHPHIETGLVDGARVARHVTNATPKTKDGGLLVIESERAV